MTLQERENFINDFYGEDWCCPSTELTLKDIDENIEECKAMLDYSIEKTDNHEIAFWRKMLQQAKVQKRSILTT